jgi:hypothetical protein
LILVSEILIFVLDYLLEKFHLSKFVLGKHRVGLLILDVVTLAEVVGCIAELAHLLK